MPVPATTLIERFPRTKASWLEVPRLHAVLRSRAKGVVFVPRLHRKHPLKSKMSGIVF